jgi:hypothetical protein
MVKKASAKLLYPALQITSTKVLQEETQSEFLSWQREKAAATEVMDTSL